MWSSHNNNGWLAGCVVTKKIATTFSGVAFFLGFESNQAFNTCKWIALLLCFNKNRSASHIRGTIRALMEQNSSNHDDVMTQYLYFLWDADFVCRIYNGPVATMSNTTITQSSGTIKEEDKKQIEYAKQNTKLKREQIQWQKHQKWWSVAKLSGVYFTFSQNRRKMKGNFYRLSDDSDRWPQMLLAAARFT